jgi:ketosteroid isomerase-like protein
MDTIGRRDRPDIIGPASTRCTKEKTAVSHIPTVQNIYEAFGRGDVAAILATLAADVEWEYGGAPSTDVPWLQARRGRAQVGGFFESLQAIEFHSFAPVAFFESGQTVVSLVNLEATVKATGARVSEVDEVHIWHFGADGLVIRFRHRADTHQHWKAYHGR